MDSAPKTAKIDTANHFVVSRSSRGIEIVSPPAPGRVLAEDEALALAAWLVAMVKDGPNRFEPVFVAIVRGI